jgi:hypothetical protein
VNGKQHCWKFRNFPEKKPFAFLIGKKTKYAIGGKKNEIWGKIISEEHCCKFEKNRFKIYCETTRIAKNNANDYNEISFYFFPSNFH